MESTKNEQLKKKYIAGAVAAVAVIGGLYLTFGGKEEPSPQGSALSQGATLSKGVEEPKTLDSFVKGTGAQQNNIQAVDSKKFISIDNISITSEQADKMMMNAINSADADRVKYLLDSGVKVDFSDDKLCYLDNYGLKYITGPNGELELNFEDINTETIPRINPIYVYTTSCNKLFLQEALKKLDRVASDQEFDIFNKEKIEYDWKNTKSKLDIDIYYNERKEEWQNDYKKKRKVYELIFEATPKKDYYQFISAFKYDTIPTDIRLNLMKLYLENIDTLPVSEGRKTYIAKYEDIALSMLQSNPNDQELLYRVKNYKNVLPYIFLDMNKKFQELLANGIYNVSLLENKNKLYGSTLILPNITVESLEKISIPYEIKGMTYKMAINTMPKHNTSIKLYSSNDKFMQLYFANSEFQAIKLILDSKKIDLNSQDYKGSTFLHEMVYTYTFTGNSTGGFSEDRANAILLRYYLNLGVNPSLMDKKGLTVHGIIQEASANHFKYAKGNNINPHKEKQDAFTLKEYN
jgi:hypothetical protein